MVTFKIVAKALAQFLMLRISTIEVSLCYITSIIIQKKLFLLKILHNLTIFALVCHKDETYGNSDGTPRLLYTNGRYARHVDR